MSNTFAQDWPQFLGPDRDNTSPQKDILRTWPAEGPEVLWSANLGIGYGGPVARDGKAYLLDRDDEVGDILRCFDLSGGKELWKFTYEAPGEIMFPGSRNVPALDGDHIYTCGPFGDLYCIDINTHQPVWHKNVWTDYGGPSGVGSTGGRPSREPGSFPVWAISQCPLIYKDLVIIASQTLEVGVVAYDKFTGEEVWKTPSLGQTGYVSPTIIEISGEPQVVMVSAAKRGGWGQPMVEEGKIIGLDPLTGKQLWSYDQYGNGLPISMALDAGDNKVIVVGGYELGTVMLKIEKNTDGTYGVTELFKHNEFGDHTKPPILHNGYFYAQFSTNDKRDGLVCMNMDGEVLWKTGQEPAFDKGSMILADGLILATDGRKKLYLIEPDPSGFKPIASAELLKEGELKEGARTVRNGGSTQNWAPIALVDGKLLIRDQQQLYCVKVVQ
jgi:outer membrane protein assembly factor BamB